MVWGCWRGAPAAPAGLGSGAGPVTALGFSPALTAGQNLHWCERGVISQEAGRGLSCFGLYPLLKFLKSLGSALCQSCGESCGQIYRSKH